MTATNTWIDEAEELLQRFPDANLGDVLKQITAHYLFNHKYGNQREVRAACDFLNLMQEEAVKASP